MSNTESVKGTEGALQERCGSHHRQRRGGGGRTGSAGDEGSGSEPWSPPGRWALTIVTALLGFFFSLDLVLYRIVAPACGISVVRYKMEGRDD